MTITALTVYARLLNKEAYTSAEEPYIERCLKWGFCTEEGDLTALQRQQRRFQEQENLIKRDFKADKPLKKLLSDITEIQCYDGKLYVSAVLDCFNGEILSIAMDSNMKKELCIRTVKELMMQYGKKLKGAIFHSDRGSQYTSEAFRNALKDAGLQQSLSGTGHCFDNARMESFFATLKKEKIYRIAAYKLTREQVKSIIFRYIFIYYNRIRISSVNPGGLAPVAYREWAKSTTPAA